ncbi:MAG: hypothetical protein DHS20C18_44180 [Saprospiraceae bacterium]|nr:MAG: hypothetical protein DHS20C18_44180 [Saprospiraceae bacterium]
MNCKEGTKDIIRQIAGLLEQLDNATLLKPLEIFGGSSLGQHFRHILDFYQCLLRGTLTGTVDYAQRERDPKIESDTRHASQAFMGLISEIAKNEDDLSLAIWGDFSSNPAAGRQKLNSTFGRELMYAYDHAIHHLAMIKIGLQIAFPHQQIEQNLGVSPSTIKYHSDQ